MSTARPTGTRRTGSPVGLVVTTIVLLLAGLVFVNVMTTARGNVPAASGPVDTPNGQPDRPGGSTTPTSAPTPTPSSTPTPSLEEQCIAKLSRHYFANDQKLDRFGLPLQHADLNPKARPTIAQTKATTAEMWNRLCRDWVFADATLASLDPSWDRSQPHSHAQVLKAIGELGDWGSPKLRYIDVPDGSWTYYMVPGDSPPELYSTSYTGGPSWYLVVKDKFGHDVKFRLLCGGQAVFDEEDLNLSIARG